MVTIRSKKIGEISGRFKMIGNGVEFSNLTGDISKLTSLDVLPIDYIRVSLDVIGRKRRGKVTGKGDVVVTVDLPWYIPVPETSRFQ